MALTDSELEKPDRAKLTQALQTALKVVENAKAGLGCGAGTLARYIVDREEGRAIQTQIELKRTAGPREISAAELRELMQDKTTECEDAMPSR